MPSEEGGAISGWELVYDENLNTGEGFEKPLRWKWVSIFGDWIKVFRHHTIEIDSLEITPPEDIPEPEDETEVAEDTWYFQTSDGHREYYHTKDEAKAAAVDHLRSWRSDQEIEERQKQLRKEGRGNSEYKNV